VASLIVGGFSFSPSWQTWLLGLINAGVLLLYSTSMIEAGNRGSYAFLMISSVFGGILIPLALGALFLGEMLTPSQGFAVLLMLISLVIMNLKGISFKETSGAYYFWCALLFLANGLYGAVMNLQASLMGGTERTEMLTILFMASALGALLTELLRKRGNRLVEGFRMGKKAMLFLLICCCSATAAANLLLHNLSLMESGILYTINNGSVLVLAILYSLILFRERPRWEQIMGMGLAVASIVLFSVRA
jgi:drug/metabolite transporter (DMT)-like permease